MQVGCLLSATKNWIPASFNSISLNETFESTAVPLCIEWDGYICWRTSLEKKWMMGVENIKKYNIILCLFNGAVNNSVYTVRSDCIVSKYAR